MIKNNLKIVKSSKNQEIENKEKNKALEAAISQIDENFGKGSVMKLGQKTSLDIESISTGSLSLDLALGIGGLPKGRVTEIYGPEASGKTTLALQVVAEAQKTGGICGFIDAEHALDPVYAKKLGVKTEELLISQPDTGEQALEITDTLIKSGYDAYIQKAYFKESEEVWYRVRIGSYDNYNSAQAVANIVSKDIKLSVWVDFVRLDK